MKKKKLKSSIPLWIASFLFVSSWVVFGVAMALKTVNVGLNGDISFTATNVYALVTGSITGTATTNTLEDIQIEASTTESELGWDNVKFDFKDETTPIVVTINVQNLSTERALYLVISENITENNTIVSRNNGINGDNNFPAVITVAKGQTHTIEITLKVNDKNKSVSDKFALNISLNSEEIKQTSDYQTLSFATLDATAKTMSVSANSDNKPTGDLAIPAQVIYNDEVYEVTTIPMGGFFNCESTSLHLPRTITNIVPGAFAWCDDLESISIEENSKYTCYENGIYEGTTLVLGCKNTIIKDGTTVIGARAFDGADIQKCIVLPDSVIEIGTSAFKENFHATIKFSKNLKIIGENAFQYFNIYASEKITSLTIPEGVTTIGGNAFAYCSQFQSITLPSTLESIGSNAFNPCTSLTSVTFEGLSGHTWKAGNTDVTSAIADSATAATYLTTDYASISWTRS